MKTQIQDATASLPTVNDNKSWGGISPFRNIIVLIYACTIVFTTYVSLCPWPMWNVYSIYPVLAFFPIFLAGILSNLTRTPLFDAKNWIWPTIVLGVLLFWISIVNHRNANGHLMQCCNLIIYASLFMLNRDILREIGDLLSKIYGGWFAISLFFFLMHYFGLSLPHYYIENTDVDYSFDCYRFFLIDTRFSTSILPRFHSTCLEPAHLAMTCIPLLLTQIGKWNKWWNISLIVATIFSFSLAGYIMLIYVIFAVAWLKGKAIVWKIMLICFSIGCFIYAATEYNNGNNMVNELIVQRMTINEDGKLTGDNRVSDEFDNDYNRLANSSKVLFGEGYEKMKDYGFGNAGYKVYIFSNGLISVFILFLFLFVLASTSPNKKVAWVFLGFQALSFIPHATPLKLAMFVPLYIFLFNTIDGTITKNSH